MDYEEQNVSKFNSGVAQAQRINDTLRLLNDSKINSVAWNPDYSDWNYNIWVNCINVLYGEVEGFLKETESKQCINVYQSVKFLLKTFPIRQSKKDVSKYNSKNYELLSQAIEYYEKVVKRYGVKYRVLVAFKEQAGRI